MLSYLLPLPPILDVIIPKMFNMISTAEVLNKVLRTGEVYLTLAVLLYATYSLNIEKFNRVSELISCRPNGLQNLYRDKLKVLFLFSLVMTFAFYLSIQIFCYGMQFFTYVKIILPEIIFYLALPFAVIALAKRKDIAFVICYFVWSVNLIFGMKLPIFLNTFAPVRLRYSIAYNINRIAVNGDFTYSYRSL